NAVMFSALRVKALSLSSIPTLDLHLPLFSLSLSLSLSLSPILSLCISLPLSLLALSLSLSLSLFNTQPWPPSPPLFSHRIHPHMNAHNVPMSQYSSAQALRCSIQHC